MPTYPPSRENYATDHILVVGLRLGISKGEINRKAKLYLIEFGLVDLIWNKKIRTIL